MVRSSQGYLYATRSDTWPLFSSTFFSNSLTSSEFRAFLSTFDTYWRELFTRASLLTGTERATEEPMSPVSLIYCAGEDRLKSVVECCLVIGCNVVEKLTSVQLRNFLDKGFQQYQTAITLSEQATIVTSSLKMHTSIQIRKNTLAALFHGALFSFLHQ